MLNAAPNFKFGYLLGNPRINANKLRAYYELQDTFKVKIEPEGASAKTR